MNKHFKSRDCMRIYALSLLSLLTALTLSACITGGGKDTGKILVTREAPIFDKRFDEISFQDLNLENFWEKGDPDPSRENIPLHNNTFAEITASIKDGVVNIYTRRLEERDAKFSFSPNDLLPLKIPLVSNLLDIVPFRVPIPYETTGFSLGSGFIINKQGYILTNAHVINNATDIRVVLAGGKIEYPAKIIGVDRMTDSALIKIEADSPLTVLPLGDSDKLRTGEMVIAIGNPLGLQHTVTSGLISSKERITPNSNDKYMDFIQTDSAINPGSSGGPLLNMYGEVVGINTAIAQQAQLIGFAVPVNTIKEVMPLLILGHTERGWFGAQAAPLTPRDAVELNFYPETELEGAIVHAVEKDSPAEKAGLQPQDIIVKLNDEPLKSFLIFRRKLMGLVPGRKFNLTIFRNGETKEVESILIKKPAPENP